VADHFVKKSIAGIVAGNAAVLALALLAPTSFAGDAQQVAAPVARDAKAVEALSAMGKYLRSLKSFSLRAETTTDEVLTNGQKVQFGGAVDYSVQIPNRLRADVRTDLRHRQFFYDGKTLTQYAPRLNYYAVVPAPATIAEVTAMAEQQYGVDIPLADLFFWGTEKSGVEDIKEAAYIGPARIGGKPCDHYAFRQQNVDWQIWIQSGKQPLPCKLLITTTQVPEQPQYTAVLTWNLTPQTGTTFAFVPPKGAARIEVAPLQQTANTK
jgi:hypothetical protein